MDPVSHVVLGRTLIALDDEGRLGRGAIAACVLGSLAPDIDLVLAFRGWDVYLREHQGGTHALIGAAACGILVASVVRIVSRSSRMSSLVVAGIAGCATHLFLDLIAGADLRPLWPLSQWRLALPLVAMADPWFVAGSVVAGVALWRRPGRRTAARILGVLALALACKGGLLARALALDRRQVPTALSRRADANFGSWTTWSVFHAQRDSVQSWRVDAVRGTVSRILDVPRGLDLPVVQRSRPLPTVRNLEASHDITFARVLPSDDGSYAVFWSDLRYCRTGDQDSSADQRSLICAVWFGGEYDRRGEPIDAVVHVGALVQRRAPMVPYASDH
jgi:inner membrane protein